MAWSQLRSKKPFKNSQQHKAPIYFLDRNLEAEKMVLGLRSAQFKLISHRDIYGQRIKVDDPEIIAYCGRKRKKLVLLTADKDLEFTYAPEITKAKIAVFILTNNRDGPDKWLPRILAAKLDMERELSTRAKPFAARINTEGRVIQVRRYYQKKDRVWHIATHKHLTVQHTRAAIPVSISSVPAQPS